MINWKRYTYAQIKKKWHSFIRERQKNPEANVLKSHITCTEREQLIDNLMSRLEEEMTKNFKESICK